MGTAIRADITVSFAFLKLGQLLCPGAEYCGKLMVRDIGITADAYEESYPFSFTYEKEDLKLLPGRQMRSNKGSYGRVLLIGGAVNMGGAVLLAASAAYRTGCGLVQVMSDEENRMILQTALPEALYLPWQQKNGLDVSLSWATAAGIGPGLGQSSRSELLLKELLLSWKGPLVLDADALNILSKHPEWFGHTKAKMILTPHPGEMARLTGESTAAVLEHLPEAAREFARKYHVVCVLKDARTVVTDGRQLYVNRTGNHGMATGGSGDVLTGVICGLLAQGMEPFEAACMGVYLHGLAGDAAAEKCGYRGMLAGDIAKCIGDVLRQ